MKFGNSIKQGLKYSLVVLSIILICFGCERVGTEGEKVYYYNLDSLMQSQQSALLQRKCQLFKTVQMASDSSKDQSTPDSLKWANELSVFNEASINRPILQGLYQSIQRNDDQSNLTIKEFTPIDPTDIKVRYLRIYYLEEESNVRKIEAEYIEENPIYTSNRQLNMTFEDIQGHAMLSEYSIAGMQKMILQDSVSFLVQGKIEYQP